MAPLKQISEKLAGNCGSWNETSYHRKKPVAKLSGEGVEKGGLGGYHDERDGKQR